MTLFGMAVADSRSGVGHYHVGSAGDFEARGWSVSASRSVSDGIRASVDYTQFAAEWLAGSSDLDALALLAGSVLLLLAALLRTTAVLDGRSPGLAVTALTLAGAGLWGCGALHPSVGAPAVSVGSPPRPFSQACTRPDPPL